MRSIFVTDYHQICNSWCNLRSGSCWVQTSRRLSSSWWRRRRSATSWSCSSKNVSMRKNSIYLEVVPFVVDEGLALVKELAADTLPLGGLRPELKLKLRVLFADGDGVVAWFVCGRLEGVP